MQFESSTQANHWIFASSTLWECRNRAVAGIQGAKSDGDAEHAMSRVRKFASGYHSRVSQDVNDSEVAVESSSRSLSVEDQELVLRFHAHQMQTLVGPKALLTSLRTSEVVLSTAITYLRRFYLSNSVVDVHPRKIAVACAFLAAKVEEEKVEVELLAHVTAMVQTKVQNAPLCRRELCSVSVAEIQAAERLVMEGLNYEFICHHPHAALQDISTDLAEYLSKEQELERRGDVSPRSSADYRTEYADELLERGTEVQQRALIFSDAPFLFAPDCTAYAVMALVLQSVDEGGCMGQAMQDYLASRFPDKSVADLACLASQVNQVIQFLLDCPLMDLQPATTTKDAVTERAEALREVLGKLANVRLLKEARFEPTRFCTRKRSRMDTLDEYTPSKGRRSTRVTPTSYC